MICFSIGFGTNEMHQKQKAISETEIAFWIILIS